MGYIVIHISPLEHQAEKEILVAELAGSGFEGFSEEGDALVAYMPDTGVTANIKSRVDSLLPQGTAITWNSLPEINWNEEWEKNYPPATILDQCYIRAPFHPERPEFRWQVLIEPKMSFGTAHHETTRLMLEWMLETEVTERQLLDMGCGTGVLAILGLKMGAAGVTAVDNDEWAWRNACDNFRLNGFPDHSVSLGDVTLINGHKFDIILANINRNILLEDIPAYSRSLNDDGIMFLSGFYASDRPAINRKAAEHGLRETGIKSLNDWVATRFEFNRTSS